MSLSASKRTTGLDVEQARHRWQLVGAHTIGSRDRSLHAFSWPRSISLDGILMAVVIALALGTAACVVVPGLRASIVAPSLDLVLDTLTTVVTLSVAVLAWVRFRQRGDPFAALQAAAFLVLAIANGLTVIVVTTGLDVQAGMALALPGQAPIYVFTFARIFAAALLVLGSLASLRERFVDHGPAIVLGSAVTMALAIALVEVGADRLPPLASIGLPALAPGTPAAAPFPSALMPLGAVAQVLAASLFLWAAGLSRRLHRRDGLIGDRYLAIGFVVAAFAQVHTAIFPSTYTGLVTSGDLLRLGFDVILLFGIQAQAAAILARMRSSNAELARLRVADVELAALEERARLSRELHDGLAQDLWLAKLTTGRLAGLADLGTEARALAGELGQTIDAGIAEAQQAIAALREPTEAPGSSFSELMSRCVYEFGDRFGLRVEFACEQDLPQLTARAQAEALRIAQEALNNVRRHADATVVRVRAGVESGRLVVVVGDNGRGFNPATVGRTAFGLASMRERAGLIGGELRIDSRPLDGTRVSLFVPLALAPVRIASDVR
jgi:signal transduction histidine kinase